MNYCNRRRVHECIYEYGMKCIWTEYNVHCTSYIYPCGCVDVNLNCDILSDQRIVMRFETHFTDNPSANKLIPMKISCMEDWRMTLVRDWTRLARRNAINITFPTIFEAASKRKVLCYVTTMNVTLSAMNNNKYQSANGASCMWEVSEWKTDKKNCLTM